jgi:hypothetical protein
MRVRTFSEALQICFLCRIKRFEIGMFREYEAGGMKVAGFSKIHLCSFSL